MNLKELFNDALPIIQKFAPSIGAAIGNPIGMAAGYVIPILASAFNSKPSEIKNLVSNIVSDPDSETKLQELEHEHGDWVCTLLSSVNKLSEAELNVKLKWQNDSQGS